MFGIGETELVIIVVFAFLLFGPDKLPGMGRTLGRMLRQFREASDGFTEVVQTSIMDPAAEELERSDKSPKQRRREAEIEAAAQARETTGEDGVAAGAEASDAAAPASEPARRETFAERKARLMAERKAREEAEAARAAEAAAAAAAEVEAESETKAEASAAETGDGAGSVASAPAGHAAPPARAAEKASDTRSATDLYAMGGRHSSRFHAGEDEAAAATVATMATVVTDTTGDVEAPAGASKDETDAKEEGGER